MNPINPETLLGDRPIPAELLATSEREIKDALAITDRLLGAVRPAIREQEAEIELCKLVRSMAEDVRLGYWTVEELKADSEWLKARAMYLSFCGGMENAFNPRHIAFLAAAVKKNDAHWFGQIALDAWNEYADAALVNRVKAKIEELEQDDCAVRQAEGIGR